MNAGPVPAVCANCEDRPPTIFCAECPERFVCSDCNRELHLPKTKHAHKRVPVSSLPPASTTATAVKPPAAAPASATAIPPSKPGAGAPTSAPAAAAPAAGPAAGTKPGGGGGIPNPPPKCDLCDESDGAWFCQDCGGKFYCEANSCDADVHKGGTFAEHVRKTLAQHFAPPPPPPEPPKPPPAPAPAAPAKPDPPKPAPEPVKPMEPKPVGPRGFIPTPPSEIMGAARVHKPAIDDDDGGDGKDDGKAAADSKAPVDGKAKPPASSADSRGGAKSDSKAGGKPSAARKPTAGPDEDAGDEGEDGAAGGGGDDVVIDDEDGGEKDDDAKDEADDPREPPKCDECRKRPVAFRCPPCKRDYCAQCDPTWHRDMGKLLHKRQKIVLTNKPTGREIRARGLFGGKSGTVTTTTVIGKGTKKPEGKSAAAEAKGAGESKSGGGGGGGGGANSLGAKIEGGPGRFAFMGPRRSVVAGNMLAPRGGEEKAAAPRINTGGGPADLQRMASLRSVYASTHPIASFAHGHL
jgi:hypothetical protein